MTSFSWAGAAASPRSTDAVRQAEGGASGPFQALVAAQNSLAAKRPFAPAVSLEGPGRVSSFSKKRSTVLDVLLELSAASCWLLLLLYILDKVYHNAT
jgi:hypothetical protein